MAVEVNVKNMMEHTGAAAAAAAGQALVFYLDTPTFIYTGIVYWTIWNSKFAAPRRKYELIWKFSNCPWTIWKLPNLLLGEEKMG